LSHDYFSKVNLGYVIQLALGTIVLNYMSVSAWPAFMDQAQNMVTALP
jgi:hypothetical protein